MWVEYQGQFAPLTLESSFQVAVGMHINYFWKTYKLKLERHTHVSLRDKNGRNIFSVSKEQLKSGRSGAANEDTRFISHEAEMFLAGLLDGLPDGENLTYFTAVSSFPCSHAHGIQLIFTRNYFTNSQKLVPTINGYKRLVGGEAFWAPNTVTYGYDSRQASIRIIAPPSVAPEATRFEIRVPGADMNPYYTLGAIFLLGIRGINKELKLKEPPFSQLTPEDKAQNKVFFSRHPMETIRSEF